MADYHMFKSGNKVMVLLNTNGSCEVSLDGAKIDGKLGDAPIKGGGTLEFLSQHATDGLTGTSDFLASGPATLTDRFTYTPVAGNVGKLIINCNGERATAADNDALIGGFVVKSPQVVFPLKTLTAPVKVEIYKID